MSKLDIYQEVTETIIAQLNEGVIPWRKPWQPGSAPQNLISGKAYRGVNTFLLGMKPYSSPYWLTYNQAKARGGHIRKGERGTRIIFWNIREREVVENDETTTKNYLYLKYWSIFNLEQCEGIEAPPSGDTPFTSIERADQIVATMQNAPTITHNGGDRAYYVPMLDSVHMPTPEQFTTSEAYYATLFHELAHSTGHKSRLARPDLMTWEGFGSEPYSREELVAEMSSAMLCGVTGIAPLVVENSAAYIASWLKQLQNDKKLLITAAGLAQKAADFILNEHAEEEGEEKAA